MWESGRLGLGVRGQGGTCWPAVREARESWSRRRTDRAPSVCSTKKQNGDVSYRAQTNEVHVSVTRVRTFACFDCLMVPPAPLSSSW